MPFVLVGLVAPAFLASPDGLHIFSISAISKTISRDVLGISEWMSPWHSSVRQACLAYWFIMVLTVALTVRSIMRGRSPTFFAVALSATFLVMSLFAARFAAFWGIVNAPLLYELMASLPHSPLLHAPLGVVRMKVVTFSGVALGILFFLNPGPLLAKELPLERLRDLHRRHPIAKIYNTREWGGILEYVGTPVWQPSMDGRLYLYDMETWSSYNSLAAEPSTLSVHRIVEKNSLFVLHAGVHGRLAELLQESDCIELVEKIGAMIILSSTTQCQSPRLYTPAQADGIN